jgi:hypothetical protein
LRTYYSTLDIGNDSLIIDHATLAEVTDMIRAGMGSPTSRLWNGRGITSSDAQAGAPYAGATGIGVLRNITAPSNSGGALLLNTFGGQSLAGNEILVRYTWYGDFNLDGAVTSLDFALFEAGLNGAKQWGSEPGWYFGDANLDGRVDMNDYSLMSTGYAAYLNSFSHPLPEPGTLGLLSAAVAGLIISRRARRRG